MCGVNFILDKNGLLNDGIIQKMNDNLIHRGPDNSSHCKYSLPFGRVFLGNTRLAITDPVPGANQPMESGRGIISYNGEVYNVQQIKNKLANTFRTESDTEVLLHDLDENGIEAIQHWRGMFSFVYLDKKEGKIHACRDFSGIKPLYLYQKEGLTIISSELSAIISSGLVDVEVNEIGLSEYFRFRYTKPPGSILNNIRELKPGECLTLTDNITSEFLNYTGNKNSIHPENALSEALKEMSPNLDYGISFSGGIDSSLLLAGLGENTPSFYLQSENELENQRVEAVAKHFNSKLLKVTVPGKEDIIIEKYLEGIDYPVADPGGLATWLVSREASKSVKILFNGAGADEFFAGYNRHIAFNKYLKYHGLFAGPWAKWGGKSVLPFIKNRHLRILLNSVTADKKETFLNFTSLQTPFSKKLSQDKETFSSLQDALIYDQQNYLTNDVLKITDMNTMQHSIECRVPFLHPFLIFSARSFSGDELIKHGGKSPLKSILQKRIPENLMPVKKEGFGVPINKWLSGDRLPYWTEIIQNRESKIFDYVSFSDIQKLLKWHGQKRSDFSAEIWSAVVMAYWMEKACK